MQDEKQPRIYPVEEIDLPSKGLCYKKDNPLSSGTIEMQYLTAKEEDILSNQNYIKKGTVLDKLFQSMIVSNINYEDLLIADKDGIMIAARILSYGADYDVKVKCPKCEAEARTITINLSKIDDKIIDFSVLNENNEFEFKLPVCKKTITFKLLTIKDEKEITQELNMHKQIAAQTGIVNELSPDVSTRLKHLIVAVDGNRDINVIRKFIDSGEFLAADSYALRKYLKKITPGVDLTYKFVCNNEDCGHTAIMSIPMDVSFFWPDAGE
jgi:hypothetical protein